MRGSFWTLWGVTFIGLIVLGGFFVADLTNDRDVQRDRAEIAVVRAAMLELQLTDTERLLREAETEFRATVRHLASAEASTLACQTASAYLSRAGTFQVRAITAPGYMDKAEEQLDKAKRYVAICSRWKPTIEVK